MESSGLSLQVRFRDLSRLGLDLAEPCHLVPLSTVTPHRSAHSTSGDWNSLEETGEAAPRPRYPPHGAVFKPDRRRAGGGVSSIFL